jgi:rhodanese-related sulfurtransferase
LSVQNADRPSDAVNVETTWQSLVSRPGAQLIDVRARAEWTYVGIPDFGAIGKRAVLVEWQTFRDQTVDPRFVECLAGELKVLGAQLGKGRVSLQYNDTSSGGHRIWTQKRLSAAHRKCGLRGRALSSWRVPGRQTTSLETEISYVLGRPWTYM